MFRDRYGTVSTMRRHLAASGLLLLSLMLLSGCHAQEKPPLVLSQVLAVTLDPQTHSLSGTSTFSFIHRNADTLRFELTPRATVLSVREGRRNLPFSFADGHLSVPLSSLASSGRASLSVDYRGTFNDTPRNLVSSEDPTYGVAGVIGSSGIFLGSDAGWYPESASLPMERLVTITVPPWFYAITGGERISERIDQEMRVSVWKVSAPGERLALSAGPYRVTERQLDGITVATYLFQENAPLAGHYLSAAVEHLRTYQGLLGPYPYKKFAVVENFLPTGYGFPSYTLIGSSVLRLPFISNTSLPHEIVHCWFGNGVRVDYRWGNWSEGLATYLADHLMEERRSPQAAVEYRRRLLADYASLVSPATEFPLAKFSGRVDPASRAIGYGKGAMVFHMVRLEIGDQAFYQGLRDLLQDKMFQKVSWSDFIHFFSATSGRDMTPFFVMWLQRAGGPRLVLKEVKTVRDGMSWRVSGVVVQSGQVYAFPLSLRLENTRDSVTINLRVKEERTPFNITVSGKPRRLLLDPDADLFRILPREELPPSVNLVKGSRRLAVIRAGNCRADAATLSKLLQSMGHGKVPVQGEDKVAPGELGGHDLLICGIPRRPWLLPEFSGPVSVAAHSFAIESTSFESPGDALFAVGQSRVDAGRVAALFHPLSAAAGSECMPKITHYGKYGYLAFRDGKNLVKGSFPGQGGGAVVHFPGADDE